MLAYQSAFRPTVVRLAQTPSPIVQPTVITPGQRSAAIALGAAQTAFGIVAFAVGARAGMKEHGAFSTLGYVVAAGGALFGAVNLLGTIGMVAKSS